VRPRGASSDQAKLWVCLSAQLLPKNAQAALNAISPDLWRRVSEASTQLTSWATYDVGGRQLQAAPAEGLPAVVSRTRLEAVLLHALDAGEWDADHAVLGFREDADGVSVQLEVTPTLSGTTSMVCQLSTADECAAYGRSQPARYTRAHHCQLRQPWQMGMPYKQSRGAGPMSDLLADADRHGDSRPTRMPVHLGAAALWT
jgi:hypothetical protein